MGNLKMISASAGSGKTYRITEEIVNQIINLEVPPNKIIATTFTVKAAEELYERIKEKLLDSGYQEKANEIDQALIGTVNSICLKLLKRYAIYAGLSPELETIDEIESSLIFEEVLGDSDLEEIVSLSYHFYTPNTNGRNSEEVFTSIIKKIIDSARNNNLSSSQFNKFAKDSSDKILCLFPLDDGLEFESLKSELNIILKEIDENFIHEKIDSSEAKKNYFEFKQIQNSLSPDNAFIWDDFRKLNNWKIKKAALPKGLYEEKKEQINKIVAEIFLTSTFHEDYSRIIHLLFEKAQEVMDAFETYKASFGFMDYTDQETKLYHLLNDDKSSVAGFIREQYDLLVVDEFQDTSPLQLAIFSKLRMLVNQSIWVGDPKQSIYGFRGTDPSLIQGVFLNSNSGESEILEYSYRSRADLISFNNKVFTSVFDSQIPSEQIILKTADYTHTGREEAEEKFLQESVYYWTLEKKKDRFKREDINHGLITLISNILNTSTRIYDKKTSKYRPATFGDIAILSRTNDNCISIANALNERGIPSSVEKTGLIREAEVVVILSMLKLLRYPYDTLAKAELLLYLEFDGDQEAMIKNRMEAKDINSWRGESGLLDKLEKFRPVADEFPINLQIEKLISDFELNKWMVQWGNFEQRSSNLRKLQTYCEEYMEICSNRGISSSTEGFLIFINDLGQNEQDFQGIRYGDGVQVMTYFKSKGLEWPIVILTDLDRDVDERDFYGVHVESEGDSVNQDEPLKDRQLMLYWKPYENKSKLEVFDMKVSQSVEYNRIITKKRDEIKRLYYVGFTRAKDYLYLVSEKNKFIPDTILPGQFNLSENQAGNYKFEGDPDDVNIVIRQLDVDNIGIEENEISPKENYFYFESAEKKQQHKRLVINPSNIEPVSGAEVKSVEEVNEALLINRDVKSLEKLGDIIHHIMAFYLPEMDDVYAIKKINGLISRANLNLSSMPDSTMILKTIKDFYTYLTTNYPGAEIKRELKVESLKDNGQKIEGIVDLVLILEDEVIIIDYKTFLLSTYIESMYREKALSFSGQLQTYAQVLNTAYRKKVRTFIYFILEGKIMEVIN